MPIIFHNLEGYDGHIIFKELNNFDVTIDVIPKIVEKYMIIIVNTNVTFIDLNEFYKGSLDTLALSLDDKDFKYLLAEFSPGKLKILKRKDAYAYEWVDSFKTFNYPQLRPKGCFYSSLRNSKRDKSDGYISDEQYLHLKNVWIYLILINLKTFTVIIQKKTYYYWLMYLKSLFLPP